MRQSRLLLVCSNALATRTLSNHPFIASDATSFVPTRVAPWHHLNILRKPVPPMPILPTTYQAPPPQPQQQTFYHETKPVTIHNHVDIPANKLKAMKREKQKKNSRSRCWIILLIIIIIYLLANNIFLNVRVLNMTPSSTVPVVSPTKTSSAAPTSTSTPVSAEVTNCLSQFKLNAPSNPTSYPCSTCAPILQAIPNDLSPSTTNPPVTGQGAVLQFCALRDITSLTANNTLQNVGWVANANFCTWKGISCDSTGRITSL